ncbi:MAG: hypothetical protein H6502_00795 [Candidatus Woesearchaeota archaeon]|nr:MAG: hypothetical protein H6502_00795 [Candidatus Woesearchaeota archaeon]
MGVKGLFVGLLFIFLIGIALADLPQTPAAPLMPSFNNPFPPDVPAVCGNTVIEPGEFCDDGAANGNLCTPLYGASCLYCTLDCEQGSVVGLYCGDNIITPGEETCEENADCSEGNWCNACSCEEIPECGDGILDEPFEECDEGVNNTNSLCFPDYGESCTFCNLQCELATLQGPYCGDDEITDDEECEVDSDCSSDEECSSSCACVESSPNGGGNNNNGNSGGDDAPDTNQTNTTGPAFDPSGLGGSGSGGTGGSSGTWENPQQTPPAQPNSNVGDSGNIQDPVDERIFGVMTPIGLLVVVLIGVLLAGILILFVNSHLRAKIFGGKKHSSGFADTAMYDSPLGQETDLFGSQQVTAAGTQTVHNMNEIVSYVNQCRAQKFSDDDIKLEMLKADYPPEVIDQAFANISTNGGA